MASIDANGDTNKSQVQTDTTIPNDKQAGLNSVGKGKKPPQHAFSDYTQYRMLNSEIEL